ncbi:MAG TPA: EAL domain-containing protein [Gaiellaceae bacterium]|nr:EAL domain-containing protein [Gaiellaceae bacterium]
MSNARNTSAGRGRGGGSSLRLAVLPGGREAGAEQQLQETQARHSAVLDSAFDAIVTMDHAGNVVDFNQSAERMFGYSSEFAVGRSVADLIVPPSLREAHSKGLARHLETGRAAVLGHPMVLRALRADGTEVDVELTINRVDLPSGPLFTASIRDISERLAVERELRAAEERYRTLVEQLPLIVYVDEASEGSPNLYTSPQTSAILGYSPEEWRDPNLLERILHPDDRERVLAEVHEDLDRVGPPQRTEYRLIARDGRTVWVRDEASAICDAEGRPRQWQGYLLDVTAERQAATELERLAFSDPLTGLANRAMLERTILERGEEDEITLLYLDLDDFKTVNDGLGHSIGDELLAIVAERLSHLVRESDLVARIGGDEFGVLVAASSAEHVAKRIVASLRQPISVGGHELAISASVGIAEGHDPSTVLRHADMAMYDAKGAGGDTYRFFEQSMHEAAVARLQLLNDLSRPSFEHEVFLEYQPIFELGVATPTGVEALIRWQHPKRGLVSPLEFVGLAEESGKIVEIGRFVLRTACLQVAAWTREHGASPYVSVNVAARQLAAPSFAAEVATIVKAAGVDASRIALELTESALMTGDAIASANLAALRKLGVRVAIDDFGTGYSSLAYLAKLPIDTIKIDRSFVDECDRSAEGKRIVEMITTLGHSLGLGVLAEGIERESQLVPLRAAGCDAVQGYLLGRPAPAGHIARLLSKEL